MADTTTISGLPYPEGSDANNVPSDLADLADALDGTIVKKLTSVEIAGLAAGEKPAGTLVYNSTTGKLQISNGSAFVNVTADSLPLAGGTMSGAIAMASQKITGLAAGTTAGNAVRYEQVLLLSGGTMTGPINMGSDKITGLTKGTAAGEAMARQQVQTGISDAISNGGTADITFSPAFGTEPTVLINVHGSVASPRFWTSLESTTGFRISNDSGSAAQFTWIAVGN